MLVCMFLWICTHAIDDEDEDDGSYMAYKSF